MDGPTRRSISSPAALTAFVFVTGAAGAIVGVVLQVRFGIDEVTVLSVALPITPSSVSLYAMVGVGTSVLALLGGFVVVTGDDR